MLSSVLRSKRAVQVNIAILRAFVRLRELLATTKDLAVGEGVKLLSAAEAGAAGGSSFHNGPSSRQ